MSLTPQIDISRLILQLESLEHQLQLGERSVKLQLEAQQMIRTAADACFLQQKLEAGNNQPCTTYC